MLSVLIKQVVENLLVKKSDALKVVATARLKTDNFVYKSIRLMGEVGDDLLSLDLLANISRIVTDLKLYGVYEES